MINRRQTIKPKDKRLRYFNAVILAEKKGKKNHSSDRVGRFLHPNGLFFSVYI